MKSISKYLLVFILDSLLLISSFNAFPFKNKYDFERISIDQGLSQSTVYCILQDYLGYMWFGTEDGLNRYDGYGFKVFQNNSKSDSSLSNNRIMALLQDSDNNLWIGTLGGGLNLFNRSCESFKVFRTIPGNPKSLASDIVMSLCEDGEGNIWVGTAGGGVSVYTKKNNEFTNYNNQPGNPKSIPGNLVRSLFTDSNNRVYLGTDKGLCVFDNEKQEFIHIKDILNVNDPVLNRTVISIFQDYCGDIWFSIDESGVVRYYPSSNTYEVYSTSASSKVKLINNSVLTVYQDDDRNYWFATYNGLQLFDKTLQNSTHFASVSSDPYSLSSNIVRCIHEDREGVMWIGTYRDGINKFNRKYQKFIAFRSSLSLPGSLPASSVRSMFETKEGNLYIATYGNGLVELDTKTGIVTNNPLKFPHSFDQLYKQVTALVFDSLENLWVGFDGGGLLKFDSNKKLIADYQYNILQAGNISSNRIRCLYVDRTGTLWVGTTGDGLCRYDNKRNIFITYKPNANDVENSLSQERILCIYEDSKNNLWVGTSSEGLNNFDRQREKSTHYKNNSQNSSSLSSNRVLCIYEDAKSRLWIGTGGGGLNLFDYETKTFKAYRMVDGLPNDVIYGILEDDNGILWLSTNNGICRFELNGSESPKIRNYYRSDGLQSNEFTESSYLKLRSGEMVFAGINGINIFNPLTLQDNPVPPSVIIEWVTLFKNPRKTGERISQLVNANDLEQLKLRYSQNNITFNFVALHFQNPSSNKYLYKLEGFDNNWISPVVGQRFATYTNLSPGNYTFRVIAANSDGVWNQEGDSLKLTIKAPFWQTWWFIGLVIIVVIGVVVIIIRQRETGLKRMQRLLEEKVRMRTKEIMLQKEEIESQRDYLSQLNAELQQKNEEILTQHNELERTQKQLLQSEKMASIGILTAGIAHEINNPINFVYAGVSSITKDFNDIDRVLEVLKGIDENDCNCDELIKKIIQLKKEYEFDEAHQAIIQTLNDIKLGAERTAEIVEGLRNFSRTENEEWTSADLHRIIDGVLVLLKNKYKNHIEIVKNYDENLTEIECKTGKINQVIMNILSNAIDAIDDRGSITITTKKINSDCVISIKDSGKGMGEAVVSRIFDPFFTTKAVGRGVGLGLSITYGIIQEHNGYIDVTSKIGQGTEFVITIPLNHSR